MRVDFQILSTYSVDSYPCIAIISENSRILIDCGEGTQRLCIEHRIRLSKLECICLTRLNPQTMGGLPGLCLTAEGAGLKKLKMFGPNNLNIFWNSLINFMRPNLFEQLSINTASKEHITIDNEDEDKNGLKIQLMDGLTLIPVVIDPTRVCYLVKTNEIPGVFDVSSAIALGVPKGPLYGQLKKGNTVTLENGTIIKPEQVLGPPDLAAYIGIICDISKDTFGSSGSGSSNSSSSSEEEQLRIQQVLINHPLLSRFHTTGALARRLQVLIHLSDEEQMNCNDYRQWCQRFGSDTKHIWCGKGSSSSVSSSSSFVAAAAYADKLHAICPSVFNKVATYIPEGHANSTNNSSSNVYDANVNTSINDDDDNCRKSYYIRGESLSQFVIAPSKKRGFITKDPSQSQNKTQTKSKNKSQKAKSFKSNSDTDIDVDIDDDDAHVDVEWTEETLERLRKKEQLLEIARAKATTFTTTSEEKGISAAAMSMLQDDTTDIVFLGTGSAVPSKLRNVSSILLSMGNSSSNGSNGSNGSSVSSAEGGRGGGALLMDAGEGTWQQLMKIATAADAVDSSDINYGSSSSSNSSSSNSNSNSNSRDEGAVLRRLLNTGHTRIQSILSTTTTATTTATAATSTSTTRTANTTASTCTTTMVCDSVEERLVGALRVVWISHPHADHHLGLLQILSRVSYFMHMHMHMQSSNNWSSNDKRLEPLLVLAPPAVLRFLYCFVHEVDPSLRGSFIGISNRILDSRDQLVFGDQTFDFNYHQDMYLCCNVNVKINTDDVDIDVDIDVDESSSLLVTSNTQTIVVAPTKPLNRRYNNKNNKNSSIDIGTSTPLKLKATEIASVRTSCLDLVLKVLQSLGLRSFHNAPVLHCYQSYAVAMEVNAGYKIVYSGDTRPCPTLVGIGRGTTVLIHESTFEDEKLEEAQKKFHSTIGEALTSGATMGAYRVILTHFSQRYPNLPKLPEREEMKRAVLAFDYMSFSLKDLEWLPALTPILEEHFPPKVDSITTFTSSSAASKEEDSIYLNRKCNCCPISLDFCALVSSNTTVELLENGNHHGNGIGNRNSSDKSPSQKRKRQVTTKS